MILSTRVFTLALPVLFGLVGCQMGERQDTHGSQPTPSISVPPLAADSGPSMPVAFVDRPVGTIRFGDSGNGVANEAFFPGTTYDPSVPHPDTILRQPLGTFTAHHAEVMAAMRAMAAKSDRMRIVPFGKTHEGRELVSVVIASPENLQRIDALRADIARLADPRGANDAEIDRIVKDSPAIAWLGYSIHGDEMSGSDASLAVAYHFAAGTSANVMDVLKEVVVVIDPDAQPRRARACPFADRAEFGLRAEPRLHLDAAWTLAVRP